MNPTDRQYASTHEWLRIEGDEAVVGITDHAQEALGDITYVDLPAPGRGIEAGVEFGAIESVKAASDLYAPASGEVLAVNARLQDAPELVNQDPYGEGWMIRIRLRTPAAAGYALLDAAAYERQVQAQG